MLFERYPPRQTIGELYFTVICRYIDYRIETTRFRNNGERYALGDS